MCIEETTQGYLVTKGHIVTKFNTCFIQEIKIKHVCYIRQAWDMKCLIILCMYVCNVEILNINRGIMKILHFDYIVKN